MLLTRSSGATYRSFLMLLSSAASLRRATWAVDLFPREVPKLSSSKNFKTIGEAIWIQAERRRDASNESLLDIAADIAGGESLSINDSTLPINFLANGQRGRTLHLERENVIGTYWNEENLAKLKVEMPVSITLARASGLPEFSFNGSNFEALTSLAKAKSGTPNLPFSESQLRGFGLDSAIGLSFVFSPWSDFCLLCWEFYDRLLQEGKRVEPVAARPFLILGRDYYPLYNEYVLAGDDWALSRMVDCNHSNPRFWSWWDVSTRANLEVDPSTRNLFGTIAAAATGKDFRREWQDLWRGEAATTLEEFIGRERIFIYNAWPWFRSGTDCTGPKGIHPDFSSASGVSRWLNRLIDTLIPRAIATLGDWSWDNDHPGWLHRKLFNTPAANVPCDSFYHPSRRWEGLWDARSRTKPAWSNTWRNEDVRNCDAFTNFLASHRFQDAPQDRIKNLIR
jgi:hypothetical protein